MTRPFDPELDLDAFLDSMEQGDLNGRRSGVDCRRRVERYIELRQLNEALRDFAWDLSEREPQRIRRLS